MSRVLERYRAAKKINRDGNRVSGVSNPLANHSAENPQRGAAFAASSMHVCGSKAGTEAKFAVGLASRPHFILSSIGPRKG